MNGILLSGLLLLQISLGLAGHQSMVCLHHGGDRYPSQLVKYGMQVDLVLMKLMDVVGLKDQDEVL